MRVEQLESRDLPSVTITGGVLRIEAQEGFTAAIVDQSPDGNLIVFYGDETHFFDADSVHRIMFSTSEEGGDLFLNLTDEEAIAFLYGAENVSSGARIVIDHSINSFVESLA